MAKPIETAPAVDAEVRPEPAGNGADKRLDEALNG